MLSRPRHNPTAPSASHNSKRKPYFRPSRPLAGKDHSKALVHKSLIRITITFKKAARGGKEHSKPRLQHLSTRKNRVDLIQRHPEALFRRGIKERPAWVRKTGRVTCAPRSGASRASADETVGGGGCGRPNDEDEEDHDPDRRDDEDGRREPDATPAQPVSPPARIFTNEDRMDFRDLLWANNVVAVREFLAANPGVDLNDFGPNNHENPIVFSANDCGPEMIKMLLDAGANKQEDLDEAARRAAYWGKMGNLILLRAAGAAAPVDVLVSFLEQLTLASGRLGGSEERVEDEGGDPRKMTDDGKKESLREENQQEVAEEGQTEMEEPELEVPVDSKAELEAVGAMMEDIDMDWGAKEEGIWGRSEGDLGDLSKTWESGWEDAVWED